MKGLLVGSVGWVRFRGPAAPPPVSPYFGVSVAEGDDAHLRAFSLAAGSAAAFPACWQLFGRAAGLVCARPAGLAGEALLSRLGPPSCWNKAGNKI